ncbi:MAG: hypothetical protein GX638_06520 [Crenarchaeota archaeon]|nr:hypothetical protein [Thermoproteota archaeon]
MKNSDSQKRCILLETEIPMSKTDLKCVTMLVFEEAGKTILQPLVSGYDAHQVQDLFENKILEVWLPNGKTGPAQFDVNILKYKQQVQSSKKCSICKDLVCLKNHSKNIVSCEQCPIYNNKISK